MPIRYKFTGIGSALAVSVLSMFLACCSSGDSVPDLKSEYTPSEQKQAAEALLKRVTGKHANDFEVLVTPRQKDGKDWFSFYASDDGRIVLEGNTGVSVASALHRYLRQYCGYHISWCGSSTELPERLPLPVERVDRVSPYKFRYYLNYCTFNYSMSWWDHDRWQQEIDFMAMNGINMPLAITGQNTVWQKVYRKLGFTDEELDGFFSGPAFFNWFWMGNLDGWGGPLPQSFIDAHEDLQKFILCRERSLGMTPVLPAFTGHVPPSFETRFPEAKIDKTEWIDYPAVSILSPSDSMFTVIAKMFVEEEIGTYGTNHYYTADTFNENLPPTSDPEYLASMSNVVYEGMAGADPDAVWVMQAWLFYHQADFWGDRQIKALLDPVPDDRMLLLDLFADMKPVWKKARSFYGKPWIWCMLQNFGQRQCLCGTSDIVASEPSSLLHRADAGNMSGIGLTMEGINQNPFIFALMLENVWQDTPVDVDAFLGDYLSCRYGLKDAAPDVKSGITRSWKTLVNSVYSNHTDADGGRQSVMTKRPVFASGPDSLQKPGNFFPLDSLVTAWDGMMNCAGALSGSDGFRYDLVDVTRQVLVELLDRLHYESQEAFYSSDSRMFIQRSSEVLSLMHEIDDLLATRKEFLLGPWVEAAKALGTTPEEKSLYEWNAKTQITLWGKPGSPLNDYACKNWSGLVDDFYCRRYEMFYSQQQASLAEGRPFDYRRFMNECLAFEERWAAGDEIFPVESIGDEIGACMDMYRKYRKYFNE